MFLPVADLASVAVTGYGQPTTGDYSAKTKGYKTFGTIGQGSGIKGVYDAAGVDCTGRTMDVVVVAKVTQATTLSIAVGSYEFDTTLNSYSFYL